MNLKFLLKWFRSNNLPPTEFKRYLKNKSYKKIISLGHKWANYFIPCPSIGFNYGNLIPSMMDNVRSVKAFDPKNYLEEIKRNKMQIVLLNLYAKSALFSWKSADVRYVRRFLIGKGDPLSRACHNKKYKINDLLNKIMPITEGFSENDISIFIPDIDISESHGIFIEAPKKYLPFLLEMKDLIFDKIVFYYDENSPTYYSEKGVLYLNTCHFNDEDPRDIIYEIIAKRYLPKVKSKLWELEAFQNTRLSHTDRTADNIEDRFVNDFIAYKSGHSDDVFVSSFFGGLNIS